MQVFKSLVFFIFYLLLLLNNTTYGQLKGNLVYNRLYPDEFSPGRSGVRITSIIPNFDFSWSGGEISKIENINGDWLITLRSGLQTLTISHTDFKSIDISLDLRNDWIQVYEIIPNYEFFNRLL